MEMIKELALFVAEPLCNGFVALVDFLLFMTPAIVFCGVVYWIFS